VTMRYLTHIWSKSVQRCDLGAVARIKYNQDRTTKKSQKRNISHIWGQAPCNAIAMKFGTGADVHEVVSWAEFDLYNLRGVNFTGG